MSIRLSKSRAPCACAALLAFALLTSASGCGSEFVATGAAGSSGSAASAGRDTTGDAGASDAGSAGESEGGASGSGMGGSSAGSAGKPSTTCMCSSREYCVDGTATCRPCASFERIHFQAPEKLSAITQAPGSSLRFPRYGGSASSLFYTTFLAGTQGQIWYASSMFSGVGKLVSSPNSNDSAALLAPGFLDQNIFFTRFDGPNRKIWMANWDGMAVSNPQRVAMPVNQLGNDDSSFAVAPNASRAYWMSNRNGQSQLLTQDSAMSGGSTPATVDLEIGTCAAQLGEDATPWVDLDGTVLLFRSQSLNADCELGDSSANDLFAVGLKGGMPSTQVVPLASVNVTGGKSDETDPSMSPDLCTLYFASGTLGGSYSLFRAQRN